MILSIRVSFELGSFSVLNERVNKEFVYCLKKEQTLATAVALMLPQNTTEKACQ